MRATCVKYLRTCVPVLYAFVVLFWVGRSFLHEGIHTHDAVVVLC